MRSPLANPVRTPSLRAAWGAVCTALLLVLVAAPACTHQRSSIPTAEESLPPSPENDPDLPKKSSLPGEEEVGTVLLIGMLLAAAAGVAYLSFIVIPHALK